MAQAPKTELYNLIKKIWYDSTGYENVGAWSVGELKAFPIKWKEDRLIMSEDTSINFYRIGTADISIKGKTIMAAAKPIQWNVMLKGPRSGYSSFSILGTATNQISPKQTIDSIFGDNPFKATLIKSCDNKPILGYYYY